MSAGAAIGGSGVATSANAVTRPATNRPAPHAAPTAITFIVVGPRSYDATVAPCAGCVMGADVEGVALPVRHEYGRLRCCRRHLVYALAKTGLPFSRRYVRMPPASREARNG